MNIRRSAAYAVSILFVGAAIGCMNTGDGTRDGQVAEGALRVVNGPDPNNGGEVTICHVPPSNPEKAHTIEVAAQAVDAHLAHGDFLGECEAAACAHGLCVVGAPLDPQCSPCVAEVCAVDTSCCETEWDAQCITQAQALCGLFCPT
ncbi:hypothetical protein [Sorangium sp. So ce363]|uniref:hypothetical protein n=1 Tax=Sorangium sp. So ce363 TaxID=3133304 RepID=UPI003F60967A